jgi:CBS domain-containing protein
MSESQILNDDDVAASEFEESYTDQREIRGAILRESLGKVPRRPMLVVPATANVAEALRLMNEAHVGCAIIVRDGKLVGIFTERDVLRRVAGQIDVAHTPVVNVMTADPDTLPASASIAFALNKMSVEGYRHIPLVDGEHRPVGVVAVRDIVAWMCSLFPSSVLNLPPAPGYPKTVDGG